MKISYNWLREFIDVTASPVELGEILTQTGLEVESVENIEKIKGGLKGLVVGKVVECVPHPNADKLKTTKVDAGDGTLLSIVCGAPNIAEGQHVIVAPVNTVIYPTTGEPFTIKKSKIRGEVSEGMLCAEDEIGMGTSHDGLLILDANIPVGTPVSSLFESGTDAVFEIGLTPNRGDAASHLGTARDLRAYFDKNISLPDTTLPSPVISDPIDVDVQDTAGCVRYSGITIRNIKIGPSPDWLQWRLSAIGLDPINNIVDITNYVLHSLGQPLHAFDADEIKGGKVLVKTLAQGTSFTTLDEKERKLDARDLMICNTEEGMCIAGVFGGIKSGIKDTTTSIFLESACFSPDYVRGTVLRHNLSTDAAFRFERGTDPEFTVEALKYAARLILEIAGGTLASPIIDVYPAPVIPVSIAAKFSTFDKLIGEKLPKKTITDILNRLDIRTESINESGFTAIVPPYRSEVTREADLVEEVLRIYGINNIGIEGASSTDYMAEFKTIEPYKLQEDLSILLAGKGYHEIMTNSLTSEKHETRLGLGEGKLVRMLNPSSEDLGIMKPTPLYTSLEVLRYNLNRKQTNIRVFEFGKSYHYDEKYIEKNWLCLYQTGLQHDESWLAEARPSHIYSLTACVNDLLSRCGIDSQDQLPIHSDPVWQYGIEILFRDKVIARIGKLKNSISDYFDIDLDVFFAQIDWDVVLRYATDKVLYSPVSKFPEVRRDLSLVLDKKISFRDVKKISFNSEKKLLNRINVFSVYEGEQIGTDKKAYAIAFYLQDASQTLNDKQIDKSMQRLIHLFETELNAIIRK
ncbi:MAG: phenylalanine--tRNA ligase subunit beta [Cyclobacteriaceae bacterium]|nr:phenylalanine--tRNA ligase subunit beta [Cyclobacteriaceae bacterium]